MKKSLVLIVAMVIALLQVKMSIFGKAPSFLAIIGSIEESKQPQNV